MAKKTVQDLANDLHVTVKDISKKLEEDGIFILSPDDVLSTQEIINVVYKITGKKLAVKKKDSEPAKPDPEAEARARAKAEEILDEVQRKCTNLQNSVCTSLLQIINQTEEGISSQIGVLNTLKESIPQ